MKNILLLITLAILTISCGGDSKSITATIEGKDLKKIREKRNELITEQTTIAGKLKIIDAAISNLDTIKKYPLVTAFQVNTINFNHFLELQGSVATKQNLILYPEFSGLLTKIYVKEGQKVSKGQLLATIDDAGLSEQVAQMEVQLSLAKTTFERQKRLWEQKIGSEIEFLQAKATYEGQENAVNQLKSQLAKTSVRAPFSGIIDDIISEPGTVVGAGASQLLRIVNLDNMYIEAEVPEVYLSRIVPGKTVEVYFPILGETLNTKVDQVSNFINPNNRTFKITVLIKNNEKLIKPNLTAKIKINDYTNEQAILIPQSIISENSLEEQYIFIAQKIDKNDKATAKKMIVKTGKTQGDFVEVLEGVASNEIIINEGARNVKDGQRVRILNVERNE
ncbi:MAG: efflux RND transporter periplasmic adaptor subunit [Flavobacteriaceae bacterium]|jgi:membrane fusion protein (multidrug efflux system)|nr:efflux RND transporter periplasmic adaptor subunit [Flavobacteriaceae bacterium]